MRLFTALDPPPDHREQLVSLQDKADLPARWTDPDQFHITIRFIGDVETDRADRYDTALRRLSPDPVACKPYGLDVLPSRRSPRVLTLELERTDTLMSLYESVSTALESEGLDPEDRTYKPHITIGRLNDVRPETVRDFLRAHDGVSRPAFTANQFVLYESTLTSDGAIHDPYSVYPLGDQ